MCTIKKIRLSVAIFINFLIYLIFLPTQGTASFVFYETPIDFNLTFHGDWINQQDLEDQVGPFLGTYWDVVVNIDEGSDNWNDMLKISGSAQHQYPNSGPLFTFDTGWINSDDYDTSFWGDDSGTKNISDKASLFHLDTNDIFSWNLDPDYVDNLGGDDFDGYDFELSGYGKHQPSSTVKATAIGSKTPIVGPIGSNIGVPEWED